MTRLLTIALTLLALGISSCSRQPATTSSAATPSEVTFLMIPPDAKNIRYWDHRHNRIAVFETTETKFRAMFRSFKFVEINEPKPYFTSGFGDPGKSPWKQKRHQEAVAGLIYEKIEDDGGGETILYDRSTGTAYYEFAAW